jgi:hypothetical protein
MAWLGFGCGNGHRAVENTDSQELAINSTNEPSRFKLQMDRGVYDLPQSGESDKKPFPASWWPFERYGIAHRWGGGYSPTEKYDALMGLGGSATMWELSYHGPQWGAPSWWGHCNGWASYVLNEYQGNHGVRVRMSRGAVAPCSGGPGCIRFEVGDIDALMAELYFKDRSYVIGGRCNSSYLFRDSAGRVIDPNCWDANPGSLHIVAANMLGNHHRMFIIDRNADVQVWNFPVYRFEVSNLEEVSASKANALIGVSAAKYVYNPAARRFFDVTLRLWTVEDSINPTTGPTGGLLDKYSTIHTYTYVLEAASDGTIIGGEYTGSSKTNHPDFLWYSTGHSPSMTDDDLADGDNPYIRYSVVKEILELAQ